MERSIVDIARIAGTTSRTLRHYADVGLLEPSRIGTNGYRYYDDAALVRLQRILLLRELGLGIPAIARVLAGREDDAEAHTTHRALLGQEKNRIDRQIASVDSTLTKMQEGVEQVAEEMFDGFDHRAYKDEVVEAWGADAYSKSDSWWRAKSAAEKRAFTAEHVDIAAKYLAARESGDAPQGPLVQGIVARHVAWLNLSAEATGAQITAKRLEDYGDLYAGDPRFAKNYGGQEGAEFVRDAFRYYAAHSLGA